MSKAISPRTVLVTGGAGFIGSCYVGMCVERGMRVIVFDALTYAGHPENLAWIRPGSGEGSFELVQGDIADAALVAPLLRAHNIEAVVNFAAESHVDNSISGPAAFMQTNIIGTYQMLEVCRAYWNELSGATKEDFRFVQISTDEVYGSLGEEGKFSEESPARPNSPYSASKAAADHLARAWYHTYGLPTVTTHCTNNYGPRQYPEKLIPVMITNALEGKKLPVYGNGSNVRDWIHVEDHCNGVMLALTKGKPGESYDFGGDAEVRNIDLVHLLCKVLDDFRPRSDGASYAAQIHFVTDRLGHDQRYAIDDSKSQRELGFTRKHTFENALRETVQWYLQHGEWSATVRRSSQKRKTA